MLEVEEEEEDGGGGIEEDERERGLISADAASSDLDVVGVVAGVVVAGVETVVIGVATAVAMGVVETTVAGVRVGIDGIRGFTGVSTGGELGADTGDAHEGIAVGDAQEGGADEDEEEDAADAAFMLSSLFSNHWYSLFLSTGTRVSMSILHLSSIATSFASSGGITGGGAGTVGTGT
jgi:hypothetical protein